MTQKNLILVMILFSCWTGPETPAVQAKYDFKNVGRLFINSIPDHSNMLGSGAMIRNALTHNFLKYGYVITESDDNLFEVQIKQNVNSLELFCMITEFTDSEMIVVPYRHEDRGYTKTVVQQATDLNQEEKSKSSQLQTSTTTTHAGKVREGNIVEYTHSKVGIMLKMIDKRSGNLVWSNSYWYSGLELQRTIDSCIKNSVKQINKLFP